MGDDPGRRLGRPYKVKLSSACDGFDSHIIHIFCIRWTYSKPPLCLHRESLNTKTKHMTKNLFYVIDNGDVEITCMLSGAMALIEGESPISENDDDVREWTIKPIWLTDEEFNNLPEAE